MYSTPFNRNTFKTLMYFRNITCILWEKLSGNCSQLMLLKNLAWELHFPISRKNNLQTTLRLFSKPQPNICQNPVGSREKPLMPFLALLLMKRSCPAVAVQQDLAVFCCHINKKLASSSSQGSYLLGHLLPGCSFRLEWFHNECASKFKVESNAAVSSREQKRATSSFTTDHLPPPLWCGSRRQAADTSSWPR